MTDTPDDAAKPATDQPDAAAQQVDGPPEDTEFDYGEDAPRADLADHGLGDLDFAGEAPPEGAIAEEGDFVIQRNEKGDVLPVWEPIPGTGTYALVRPLSPSEAERRFPDSGDPTDLSDRRALGLIKGKFIKPDFSDVDSTDDLRAFTMDGLLSTLMNASRFDTTRAVAAENAELAGLIEGNSRTGNSDAG